MSEEEKEALNFFENKEYSFICEVPKKELYEALGIEETDFETEVIRINTLINLIKKQQKEIEELKGIILRGKIEEIVDIYDNSKSEFALLPNNEDICLSDNYELIEYLRTLLEE